MSGNSELIKTKVAKAISIMDEVDMHLENKFYITAINRLYYGCFHATTALLLTKGLVAKTHSGVSSLLNQHFVHAGSFSQTHARFFLVS